MIELHRGDCLKLLPGLAGREIDCVITDPPYGINLGVGNDKRHDGRHLAKASYRSYDDSYENFIGRIVPGLNVSLSLAKRGAVFTGEHVQEQAKASCIGGIWHPSAVGRCRWGFRNFLPILFYGGAPELQKGCYPTVLRSTACAEKSDHPCPKPLEWMLWLVKLCTRPGDTVLDPFMGSGTTGVACKMAGRNFIGMEIDPAYFKVAQARIGAAQSCHANTASTSGTTSATASTRSARSCI